MPKHTMLYIVTEGSTFFDGEPKTWGEVIEHAEEWRNDDMQVFELLVSTDHRGKRRCKLGDDVTEEAVNAAEREARRAPWGIVDQRRELGTVF